MNLKDVDDSTVGFYNILIDFVDFFMKFLDFWLRKLVFEFLEFVVNSPSVEEVFLLSAMDLLLETEEAILEVG